MSEATSDQVINRVLEAEKNARHEVDICRHKAAVVITDSRERVRRIMNRADERISKVHHIADRLGEKLLTDININTNLLTEPVKIDKKVRIDVDKAISLLIAELIGENHER